VTYQLWVDVDGDTHGHGSHTAGTLAADAQSTNTAAVAHLSNFNGIAYKAKLAVFDLLVSACARCFAAPRSVLTMYCLRRGLYMRSPTAPICPSRVRRAAR
jgi:hypothetical protein